MRYGVSLEKASVAYINAKEWLQKNTLQYINEKTSDKTELFFVIRQYMFSGYLLKLRKSRVDEQEIMCGYGSENYGYLKDLFDYCNYLEDIDMTKNINVMSEIRKSLCKDTARFLEFMGLELEVDKNESVG